MYNSVCLRGFIMSCIYLLFWLSVSVCLFLSVCLCILSLFSSSSSSPSSPSYSFPPPPLPPLPFSSSSSPLPSPLLFFLSLSLYFLSLKFGAGQHIALLSSSSASKTSYYLHSPLLNFTFFYLKCSQEFGERLEQQEIRRLLMI